MPISYLLRGLLMAIFFILSFSLFGQDSTNTGIRPKLGIVLSGGGARGMAHIGALKVLEEAGIQADYITGTSMGSILGGLYAIGYSADDLMKFSNTDWSKILTNKIPLNSVVMEEKHDYARFITELPFRDGKLGLPSGFIEGQKLSELFSGLTWRTIGVENFDDYPIPFRCTAADIVNGEIVVFDSGDLSTAMRASMSIPSVFTPVLLDSNVLVVDGGIMRNFPVEEIKEMGADIVIGIYVGYSEEVDPKELSSLSEVLARTTIFYGILDSKEQEKLTDILITPDMTGFSPANFGSSEKIVLRGDTAAKKIFSQLKNLADSLDAIAPPPPRKKLVEADSIFISEIGITHMEYVNEEFVLGKTGLKANSWIKKDELNAAIDKVFGTLYFDKITYRFEKTDTAYRLILDVKEKPQAFLKFALHYDNYYDMGITLNFTKRNLWLPGSRFTTSVNISKYPQLRLYYHKYTGLKQRTLVSFNISASKNILPIYNNGKNIGYFDHFYINTGLAIRQILGVNNQVGAIFQYEGSEINPNESLKELHPDYGFEKYGFGTFALTGFFIRDNLNSHLYPTKGMKFILKAKQTFWPNTIYKQLGEIEVDSLASLEISPFFKIKLQVDFYQPVFKNTIITSNLTIGLSSADIVATDYYYIGGYDYNLRHNHISFVGLNLNEAHINNFVKIGLGAKQILWKNLFLIAETNWIVGYESIEALFGNIFSPESDNNIFGYGGGITYKSPIGPLSIIIGSNTSTPGLRWYLNLGFNF